MSSSQLQHDQHQAETMKVSSESHKGHGLRSWRSLWPRKAYEQIEFKSSGEQHIPASAKTTQQPANEQQIPKREHSRLVREQLQDGIQEKTTLTRSIKQARVEEEKARKKFIGGVLWGFDPTAGTIQLHGSPYDMTGGSTSMLAVKSSAVNTYEVGKRGKANAGQYIEEGVFGITYGGPGKERKHGHGSPQCQQQAKPSSTQS